MKWYILAIFVSVVFYIPILSGFFQQDEWYGFSEYIMRSNHGLFDLLKYILDPTSVHYTPFTISLLYIILKYFGMNYLPHAIISIILHLTSITLVYKFFIHLFKRKNIAGLGSLIFSVFSSGHQATSWVMADIGTHMATIFALFSLIYFLKSVKERNTKYQTFSLTFFIVSLLFKEMTLGIVVIFVYLLLLQQKELKNVFKHTFIKKLIIIGGGYIFVRLLMIPFIIPRSGSELVFETQSFFRIIYNFLSIPFKAISQSIIPIQIIRSFSEFFTTLLPKSLTGQYGSPDYETFVVKRTMEGVSLVFSSGIMCFFLKLFKYAKTAKIGILWIIINSFIFAFSPGKSGITSVIDSRNLYFVSIGAAIFLTTVLTKIEKHKLYLKILFILAIITPNIFYLHKNIKDIADTGKFRRIILERVVNLYPKLPDKVVILTISDQSYYGLPEETKIMPFQSGFGQTLLTFYYPGEKFPIDFYRDRFLWQIDSQGYKESDSRGFGYFRDKTLLKQTVEEYNLPRFSLIALEWDGKRNILKDITKETVLEIYGQ